MVQLTTKPKSRYHHGTIGRIHVEKIVQKKSKNKKKLTENIALAAAATRTRRPIKILADERPTRNLGNMQIFQV